MIITKKQLSRRTMLKGLGATIALPMLDAMTPALAAPARSPRRLGFVYVANGIIMEEWTPPTTGLNYEMKRVLKPLEKLREDLLLISGLDDYNGKALGDGAGD
ncbi:MAG: DUF1552 domain-containing protein, partial [Acidobacteriota bacterium]